MLHILSLYRGKKLLIVITWYLQSIIAVIPNVQNVINPFWTR